MAVQQENTLGLGTKSNYMSFDIYSVGAVIFIAFILIIYAQYGNQKIALMIAGLIFLTSLLMNIEKIKEVFK